MGRAPCCDKTKVKRGPWSPEEDTILKNYIHHNNGTGGNWITFPHRAGLKRCGKSCRLRWLNYLRPDIKLGGFTEEEDNIILTLYFNIGSRWSVIASHLRGRTDNDVKNHWNTKLKKQLSSLFDDDPKKKTITTNNPPMLPLVPDNHPPIINNINSPLVFDYSPIIMDQYQEMNQLLLFDKMASSSDDINIPFMDSSSSNTSLNTLSTTMSPANSFAIWSDEIAAADHLLVDEFDFQQVINGEVGYLSDSN